MVNIKNNTVAKAIKVYNNNEWSIDNFYEDVIKLMV